MNLCALKSASADSYLPIPQYDAARLDNSTAYVFVSPPLAPVPPEDYCWATSVLLSRATSSGAGAAAMASQRPGDAPPFTLVPVMDCLNHALEPNCQYAFDVRCPDPHSLADFWS